VARGHACNKKMMDLELSEKAALVRFSTALKV
jgi:hypothetical protein